VSNALTLYAIEEDLLCLLDSEGLALTDEQRIALIADIADKTEVARDKRDRVAKALITAKSVIAARKAEIKRLQESTATMEREVEQFKAVACAMVDQFGTVPPRKESKRLQGKTYALCATNNGGVCPVLITDEAAIPDRYKKITVTFWLDNWKALRDAERCLAEPGDTRVALESVRAALENFEEVPGAELGERGKHLRVL
jgi:hypothetical protein